MSVDNNTDREIQNGQISQFAITFPNSKTRRWDACRNGYMSDCTFLVRRKYMRGNEDNKENDDRGWRKFECHKIILATASEVLERMFSEDFFEDVTCIENVTSDVFEHFLKFIYTYEVDALQLDTQQCLQLIGMGYQYMMQDLIDTCVKILTERTVWITPDILPIYKFACIYENLHLLLASYKRIQNNFRHILGHESLYDLNLVQLKRLVVYLSQALSGISLMEVFKALESYGCHHQLRSATCGSENYEDLLELKSIARMPGLRNRVVDIPQSYLLS